MAVTFLCGDATFQASVERRLTLTRHGANSRAWSVLLDRPLNWAALDHAQLDFSRCIIFSDNACPSYQLDLIEREPAALLPLDRVATLEPVLDSLSVGHTLLSQSLDAPQPHRAAHGAPRRLRSEQQSDRLPA